MLAIVVVFIFLRDWRATLIAAIALPLSIMPTFWAHRRGRLLAQSRQPARHHHRHRHPGRRRHRRDREHRPPHAHGQVALPRRAGGRRRDRPRRHRHHLHHHRRVRAGELHGRHRRAVLQAVRPRGRRRRVLLAAGGASHHADARRLLHARHRATRTRKAGCCRAYTRLVRWSVRHRYTTVALGLLDLRRLDRQLLSAALGLPAGRGQRPHPDRRRAAARLAPGRDARGDRRDRRPGPRAPRGEERVRQRRPGAGLGRGGAQGDARHQPGAEGRAQAHARTRCRHDDRRAAWPACPTSASGS